MAQKEDKRIQDNPDSTVEFREIYRALCNGEIMLLEKGKKKHAIPLQLEAVIKQAVEALIEGKEVKVIEAQSLITTQEAADYLGMSRPTLVQILNEGKIPFTQPGDGKHRRIRVSDLVEYQERVKANRRFYLDRMVRISEEITSSPEYVEPSIEEILQVLKEVRKEIAEERKAKGDS